MNFPVKEFIKFAIGTLFRHLFTMIATLFVVNHYVGADIAAKLMHGDTVTLWQGYSFSVSTIVNYLVDAMMISIVPIAFGVFMRMRSKLKQRIALWLPQKGIDSGEEKVKEILAAAPLTAKLAATVTLDPSKVVQAAEANGVNTGIA